MTATAEAEATDQLKRSRALELLESHPSKPLREIAREVGLPESTLRSLKAKYEATKLRVETLRIADIRRDGDTQVRVSIDPATVDRYAEAYTEGKDLKRPVVFFDGLHYWLADGFHRILALLQIKVVEVSCEVRDGSQRYALAHALKANENHGLPRSAADKRNAIKIVLDDPEWSKLSDRTIAAMCDVSPTLVGQVQRDRIPTVHRGQSTERVTANGRTMDTSKIGKSPRRGGKKDDDEPEPDTDREPGSDDDKDEPVTHEVAGDPESDPDLAYLESIPVRALLSPRCREIFDRDALAHRRAQKALDALKATGCSATRTGEMQGAWQYQAARFLRNAYPHAWLKCLGDDCVDGKTKNGDCTKCRGRGYQLP